MKYFIVILLLTFCLFITGCFVPFIKINKGDWICEIGVVIDEHDIHKYFFDECNDTDE